MPNVKVAIFYGFELWNNDNPPVWYGECDGNDGAKNDKFEKDLKKSGLQLVESRCDGETYSNSIYYLAVENSVKDNGVVLELGVELPKKDMRWDKALEAFCKLNRKKYGILFKKPQFIICASSHY